MSNASVICVTVAVDCSEMTAYLEYMLEHSRNK